MKQANSSLFQVQIVLRFKDIKITIGDITDSFAITLWVLILLIKMLVNATRSEKNTGTGSKTLFLENLEFLQII